MSGVQEIVDKYFLNEKDKETLGVGKVRCSVFLSLIEDFKFTILLPGKWQALKLSQNQEQLLEGMMPTFTIISQFCTGIDVLARVSSGEIPNPNETGKFFKECATKFFDLSEKDAQHLWDLRNGISHSYRLRINQSVQRYGDKKIMREVDGEYYIFYLNAMYSNLVKGAKKVYAEVSRLPEKDKIKIANHLEKEGFFYIIYP